LSKDKDTSRFVDPTPFAEHPLFVMGDTLMKAFYEVSELTEGLHGDNPVDIEAYLNLFQRDLLAKTFAETTQPEDYIIHGEEWSQRVKIRPADPKDKRFGGFMSVDLYIPPLTDWEILSERRPFNNSSVSLIYSQVLPDFQETMSLEFFEPGKYNRDISYGTLCSYGLLKNGDHLLDLTIFHGLMDDETDEVPVEYKFHRFLDKDGRKLTPEEMQQRGYSLDDHKYDIS